VTLVLDAGAFLAVERGDRHIMALLKGELLSERVPWTHGGVVGEVWRGGRGRQAPVARLLAAAHVAALDEQLGRRAGALLGQAHSADPIDAAVVLLAADGDMILTSDPRDLRPLAAAATVHVDIVRV
jgi:hypothetical protein